MWSHSAASYEELQSRRLSAIAKLEQRHKMRRHLYRDSSFVNLSDSDDASVDETPSAALVPKIPTSGKYFVLLVSKESGNLQQRWNQDRAETILMTYPHQVVDGTDPRQSNQRDTLFAISKIRGFYPQLFLVESGVTTTFIGGFDIIEYRYGANNLKDLLDEDVPSTPKPKKKNIVRRAMAFFKNSGNRTPSFTKGSSNKVPSSSSTIATAPLSNRSPSSALSARARLRAGSLLEALPSLPIVSNGMSSSWNNPSVSGKGDSTTVQEDSRRLSSSRRESGTSEQDDGRNLALHIGKKALPSLPVVNDAMSSSWTNPSLTETGASTTSHEDSWRLSSSRREGAINEQYDARGLALNIGENGLLSLPTANDAMSSSWTNLSATETGASMTSHEDSWRLSSSRREGRISEQDDVLNPAVHRRSVDSLLDQGTARETRTKERRRSKKPKKSLRRKSSSDKAEPKSGPRKKRTSSKKVGSITDLFKEEQTADIEVFGQESLSSLQSKSQGRERSKSKKCQKKRSSKSDSSRSIQVYDLEEGGSTVQSSVVEEKSSSSRKLRPPSTLSEKSSDGRIRSKSKAGLKAGSRTKRRISKKSSQNDGSGNFNNSDKHDNSIVKSGEEGLLSEGETSEPSQGSKSKRDSKDTSGTRRSRRKSRGRISTSNDSKTTRERSTSTSTRKEESSHQTSTRRTSKTRERSRSTSTRTEDPRDRTSGRRKKKNRPLKHSSIELVLSAAAPARPKSEGHLGESKEGKQESRRRSSAVDLSTSTFQRLRSESLERAHRRDPSTDVTYESLDDLVQRLRDEQPSNRRLTKIPSFKLQPQEEKKQEEEQSIPQRKKASSLQW